MPQIQPLGSHLEHTQPHTTTHCMYRSSSCVTQTHTHRLTSGRVTPYTSWCSILLFFFSLHTAVTFIHSHTCTHTDTLILSHKYTGTLLFLSLTSAPPGTYTSVQSHTHSHAHCHTKTHIHTGSDTHRHTIMVVHTAGSHLHICAP